MADVYAVIMAGGRGERFWPLSTDDLPKPFVRLVGETTLLQDSVARLQPLIPPGRILISIGEAHLGAAAAQLPQLPRDNFIVEPCGRDTSACLGFSALHLDRRDREAVMLALPADHYISDREAFHRTLQKGIDSLAGATGIVFGIQPTRPETGYGYVLAEKPPVRAHAWPVLRFIEKPNASTAERYLSSGDYFWNSGMFLWKNRTLLDLIRTHLPDTWQGLESIRPILLGADAAAERFRIFSALQRVSVDFGILEKTRGLRLVPAEFGWDDIGSWAALERAMRSDTDGNITQGRCRTVDSEGCILYSDAGTVATFGISDLVVVHAQGQVLVCPKDRAADLKRLVAALGSRNE